MNIGTDIMANCCRNLKINNLSGDVLDMKIKEGFVLRELSGMNLLMPAGEKVKSFKGAVMLNESGVMLFKLLQSGVSVQQLEKALTEEYAVDAATAAADVAKTLDSFRQLGLLEE